MGRNKGRKGGMGGWMDSWMDGSSRVYLFIYRTKPKRITSSSRRRCFNPNASQVYTDGRSSCPAACLREGEVAEWLRMSE